MDSDELAGEFDFPRKFIIEPKSNSSKVSNKAGHNFFSPQSLRSFSKLKDKKNNNLINQHQQRRKKKRNSADYFHSLCFGSSGRPNRGNFPKHQESTRSLKTLDIHIGWEKCWKSCTPPLGRWQTANSFEKSFQRQSVLEDLSTTGGSTESSRSLPAKWNASSWKIAKENLLLTNTRWKVDWTWATVKINAQQNQLLS